MTDLSEEALIEYIMAKKELTEKILSQILNNLWNLGFREGADFDIMERKTKEWEKVIKLAFNDDFYNGVLVGLMYNYKDNQVKPFFGITQKLKYGDPMQKKILQKTDEWEADMLGLCKLREKILH